MAYIYIISLNKHIFFLLRSSPKSPVLVKESSIFWQNFPNVPKHHLKKYTHPPTKSRFPWRRVSCASSCGRLRRSVRAVCTVSIALSEAWWHVTRGRWKMQMEKIIGDKASRKRDFMGFHGIWWGPMGLWTVENGISWGT